MQWQFGDSGPHGESYDNSNVMSIANVIIRFERSRKKVQSVLEVLERRYPVCISTEVGILHDLSLTKSFTKTATWL